jgi:hypothetical protein
VRQEYLTVIDQEPDEGDEQQRGDDVDRMSKP